MQKFKSKNTSNSIKNETENLKSEKQPKVKIQKIKQEKSPKIKNKEK